MKKKVIRIFVLAALILLTTAAGYGVQTGATTDLAKPKSVAAYNPKPNTIYLKWSKVTGADGYYVYYSTNSNSGYKIVNVTGKNEAVFTGLSSRTTYYFKVKAYTSIGVVSESTAVVSARSSTFGIDVSKHNGVIDWDKVKSQVDYAILRVGYGNNLTSQDDEKWYYNANECTRLGIPFGVYIYSYATNTAEAASEADHVLRLIKGYKLSYPVYYDMEDNNTTGLLSNTAKGDLAQTFCDRITSAGYKVGIYANTYWFNNHLTDPRFGAWEKWVAQYNYECTYNGEYKMWQYSSDGAIDGIAGRVDMNYKLSGTKYSLAGKPTYDVNTQGVTLLAPKNVNVKVTSSTSTHVTWNTVSGATRYIVYRKKDSDKKFARVAVTAGPQFLDTKLEDRATYYYKVCAYTGDDKVAYFSQFSALKRADLYIEMPNNLRAAQATRTSIKITWSAISDATSYKVYRYDSSLKKYKQIGTSKKNSYVDSNVKTGTTYKYRIVAAKKTSTGTIYSKVSATKTGIAGPAKVSTFTADNTSPGVIKLKWKAATGANGYEVYCGTSKNGTYKRLYVAASGKTSYNVKNLIKGKKYYFKVRSVRTSGGITIKSAFTSPILKTFR